MAEFVMKDLVKKAGLEKVFLIESAATSREEIGNPVYPPARRKLAEHGIDCSGKTARHLQNGDYEEYDLLIGMDPANLRNMYRAVQYHASVQVNTELVMLYHSIGVVISKHKAWGNKFVENLAADIRREFPASKGYSVRNLKYMAKFAQTYPDREFVQQVVAQIPWGHNLVLLDKGSDPEERRWYLDAFQKIAGQERYWFTRLKVDCISGRCWRTKCQTLKGGFLLPRVNRLCKQ